MTEKEKRIARLFAKEPRFPHEEPTSFYSSEISPEIQSIIKKMQTDELNRQMSAIIKKLYMGCSEILKHYGVLPQVDKLKEETAELTEAIDIHQQCPSDAAWDHVIEEFSDCCVVMFQLVIDGIVPLESVFDTMDFKINRQLERIANGTD